MASIKVIERYEQAAGTMQDAAQDAIRALEEAAHFCEEEVDAIRTEQVERLAHVRALLKAGQHDMGREELERILDELDSAWRTLA